MSTVKSMVVLWFLIFVRFGVVPSAGHQAHLYKKAGVTLYKTCSPTTALVQTENNKTWSALDTLKKDKNVMNAAVSIEGTCN